MKAFSGKRQYPYWSALSMIQQVEKGLAPTKLINVAEAMARRAYDMRPNGKDIALPHEELGLHLLILQQQGKLEDALVFLRKHSVSEIPSSVSSKSSKTCDWINDETSVNGQSVVAMTVLDRRREEASILRKLERIDEAFNIYYDSLATLDCDSWSDWCGLFDTLLTPVLGFTRGSLASNAKEGESQIGDTVQNFIMENLSFQKVYNLITASINDHPNFRGPYLARLDLCHRLINLSQDILTIPLPSNWFSNIMEPVKIDETGNNSSGETGDLNILEVFVGFLKEYVLIFSKKLCCFEDLSPYIETLAKLNERSEFVEFVSHLLRENETVHDGGIVDRYISEDHSGNHSQNPNTEIKEASERLSKFILAGQLKRYFDTYDRGMAAYLNQGQSDEDTVLATEQAYRTIINTYAREWISTLYVNEGAEGGQREVQKGDDLVILCIHYLQDMWSKYESNDMLVKDCSKSIAYKLEAMTLLESALNHSPYNYHIRLLLMSTCQSLSAFQRSIQVYNKLEVKHIQLETLSWTILNGCLTNGFYSEVKGLCMQIIGFHTSCFRDSGEYAGKAIEQGTYLKAMEILRFQENRMSVSLIQAYAKSILFYIEIVLSFHKVDEIVQYIQEVATGMSLSSLSSSTSKYSISQIESNKNYLVDNRDTSAIKSWDVKMPSEEVSEIATETGATEKEIQTGAEIKQANLLGFEDKETLRKRILMQNHLLILLSKIFSSTGVAINEVDSTLKAFELLLIENCTDLLSLEPSIYKNALTVNHFVVLGNQILLDLLYLGLVTTPNLFKESSANSNSSSSISDISTENHLIFQGKVEELRSKFTQYTMTLTTPDHIWVPLNADTNTETNEKGTETNPIISKEWLNNLSIQLLFIIGPSHALIVYLSNLLPKESKTKKKKKKNSENSGENTPPGETNPTLKMFSEMILAYKNLLVSLDEIFTSVQERYKQYPKKAKTCNSVIVQEVLSQGITSVVDEDQLRQAEAAIVSSHEMSFSSLTSIVKSKLGVMK